MTSVDYANSANSASSATNANYANSAGSATNDSAGRNIVDTYMLAAPARIRCGGNGVNNNMDFIRDGFSGGYFLNYDRVSNTWHEILTTASGLATVASTWKSGLNWYRVWSDGFIEQGGTTTLGTAKTLAKAFSTTNYTIVYSKHNYTASSDNDKRNGSAFALHLTAKTTTSITIKQFDTGQSGGVIYYACGY